MFIVIKINLETFRIDGINGDTLHFIWNYSLIENFEHSLAVTYHELEQENGIGQGCLLSALEFCCGHRITLRAAEFN